MDGTATAWIVRHYLSKLSDIKKIRYVFANKRDLEKDISPLQVNDLNGKDIYILDYMYPFEVIQSIKYNTLTIIDHHKSAAEDCEKCKELPNTIVFFDQSYSAAGLAWVSLMNTEIPWWIQYIQDRDLFKFSLPFSREINDAMYNLKYRSFAKFDELHQFTEEQKLSFIEEGRKIGLPKYETVKSIANNASHCQFLEFKVFVVQTNTMVSEVCEYLYTTYKSQCDFVICIQYQFDTKTWKCRLRANQESQVSLPEVCKRFDPDGGGHEKSAAFKYEGDLLSLFTFISNEWRTPPQ